VVEAAAEEGEVAAGAVAVTAGADGRLVAAVLAAIVAVALVPSSALAAPTDAELSAARQLFLDAEKDEDAARWADALEKLRRVSQVKRTAGVRYHVGLCTEHLGQLATALDEYTAAEGQARVENAKDVLRLVGPRIADVAPRVPRLTIRLAPDVADAVVTLDGAPLPRASLGTAVLVDPGEHRVDATAPGRAPVSEHATLRERDATAIELRLVEVPPAPVATLAPPAAPEPAPPPAAPAEARSTTSGPPRTAAILLTAGAAVLAGGGVAAFVAAGGAHATAVEQCARVVSTSPDACDSQKNGVRGWDFAAAGAWLGAAVAGTFAVLSWTHPSSAAAAAQLFVGPASVGLGGRF
jgi:hypothetical protein